MKRGRELVDARRTKMLSTIRERQKVTVEELAEQFGVSLMTVRRDLQTLKEQGLIGRFYGGATVDPHTELMEQDSASALCRQWIGQYAASLVEDGDRLFINGSRVALNMLGYTAGKCVHVFTNNGAAVSGQYPNGVEIIILGGSLRRQSHILTGDCTMRNLLVMQAEKAFLGCTGISSEGNILCDIPTELGINETMIAHAGEYYILADHTKIGKTSPHASFSLEKPGTIITDRKAPASVVEHLRAVGMTVIQVGAEDVPEPPGPGKP